MTAKKTKTLKCCDCGRELKNDKEVFLYFDPSNAAITKSMSKHYFCRQCMERFNKMTWGRNGF